MDAPLLVAAGVGTTVTCAILLVGPQTGGSLNPARTFGPDVGLGIGGGDPQRAEPAPYWISPILGAALAAVIYDFFAQTRTTQEAATESFTATNTTTGTSEA